MTKPKLLFVVAAVAIGAALLTGCASTQRWPSITAQPTGQHTPGRWVWAELFAAEVAEAKRFYAEVFAWSFDTQGGGPEAYTLIRAGDRPIAGIVHKEKPADARHAGRWLGVLSVADTDRAAEQAVSGGGRILVAPRDFPGRGRAAVLEDPEGARFGVLHSESGDPADVFPEVDTWLWRELWAEDIDKMAEFYRPLGGYRVSRQVKVGGVDEIYLEAGGYARAGILDAERVGLPSAWLLYVRVEDLSGTLDRVKRSGGEVLLAPSPDIREGRVAIVRDPLGAVLGLAQWSEAPEGETP